MDDGDKRDLWNGFGDTLARGIEMALVPAIFGVLGWLADRALGVAPVFTILLVVFGLAGVTVRAYYGYDAQMRAEAERRPWGASRRGAS